MMNICDKFIEIALLSRDIAGREIGVKTVKWSMD